MAKTIVPIDGFREYELQGGHVVELHGAGRRILTILYDPNGNPRGGKYYPPKEVKKG